jgi:hypothetical protein
MMRAVDRIFLDDPDFEHSLTGLGEYGNVPGRALLFWLGGDGSYRARIAHEAGRAVAAFLYQGRGI